MCYNFRMIKALEQAIQKVRALPEEKQQLAAELLEELAAVEEPYILSDAERAILVPALEQAKRGEFATDEEMAALWRKCGL
jgi:ABC-type nitrate/sulfonate/bicarbonate transport system substrate-binding protein